MNDGLKKEGAKIRLDQLLLELGKATTLHQAQGLILSGKVLVNENKIDKVGELFTRESKLRLIEDKEFVSRGGDKLNSAIVFFQVGVAGRCCLDIGASTGGFTDCLLKKGASKVIAVDVGTNQLDWRLRSNTNVISIEGFNARDIENLPQEVLALTPDLVTIDLSFISVTLVLPGLAKILSPVADVLVLVKPQFEADRSDVEQGGVVRSSKVHDDVIAKVSLMAEKLGFLVSSPFATPVLGKKAKNQEFFIYLQFRN